MTISDVGERELIDRIRRRAGPSRDHVLIGIGDDAAVLAPAPRTHDVLTTDSLVEDVHFRLAWSSAHSIGRKAVLVNLSDLASMGARPRALLLSLCLPASLPLADFEALIDGVAVEASGAGASLVGGNIARSPGPLMVTITAVGSVHPRRVLTRAGARVHDELYVTGEIGGAAAGLGILESGVSRTSLAPELAACVERYEIPANRVRCGWRVASQRAANACIDLSDGLADGIRQVAEASGTGAVIEAGSVPVGAGARDWWAAHGREPLGAALTGGDDYELLFAVSGRKRRAFLAAAGRSGVTATRIGVLTAERELRLQRGEAIEPLPDGFAHFSTNRK